MTLSLSFKNELVCGFFCRNMVTHLEAIEQAAKQNNLTTALESYKKFNNLYQELSQGYLSFSKDKQEDIQTIKTVQEGLADRVLNLCEKFDSVENKVETSPVEHSNAGVLKPVGVIRRDRENNCAYNAIFQLISNSRYLKDRFMFSGCRFKGVFEEYFRCQSKGETVSQDIDTNDVRRLTSTAHSNEIQEDAGEELQKMLDIVTPNQDIQPGEIPEGGLWVKYGPETLSLQFQNVYDFSGQVQDFLSNHAEMLPKSLIVQRIKGQFDIDVSSIEDTNERELSEDETNGDRILYEDEVPMSIVSGVTAYQFTGCICHYGQARYGGHYVALKKLGNEWYMINDARVQQIEEDRAKEILAESSVYLYEQSDEPITSPKVDLQIPSWTKMAIGMIGALGAAYLLGLV